MIVYPARDIRPFVMYCVNGKPRSSLLIESTDSMIESTDSMILLTSGSPFGLWINPILLTSGSPFGLWIDPILLTSVFLYRL